MFIDENICSAQVGSCGNKLPILSIDCDILPKSIHSLLEDANCEEIY